MKLKETNKYENRREGNFKLFLFLSLFPLSQKIESPYSAMQMLVWNNRSLKCEFLRIVKRWKGNEFRSRKVAAISILLLLSPTYSTMMMFIKKVIRFFCNVSLFLFAGANFKFHRRKFNFKDPLINLTDQFWIILRWQFGNSFSIFKERFEILLINFSKRILEMIENRLKMWTIIHEISKSNKKLQSQLLVTFNKSKNLLGKWEIIKPGLTRRI